MLHSGLLALSVENGEMTLYESKHMERLLIADLSRMLSLTIKGEARCPALIQVSQGETEIALHFSGEGISSGEVLFRTVPGSGHLEMEISFLAAEDLELNRVSFFPEQTKTTFWDLVNFRNQHGRESTWPDLPFHDEIDTNTYSTDWQFAPHPTMMIFRKPELSLLFGALELPRDSFGMYLKANHYHIESWYLDYGRSGWGLELKKGTFYKLPRMCLLPEYTRDPHVIIRSWVQLLIEKKEIPDPRKIKRYPWHLSHVYCTYQDYAYRKKKLIEEQLINGDLKAQSLSPTYLGDLETFCEDELTEELNLMQKEELKFGIFIIDARWSVMRGVWRADPKRFPHLRQIIDRIHKMGMKVILWWGAFDIEKCCDVGENSKYLIAGGRRNRHGQQMFDMSNPITQEEFLKPLLHYFLSPDDGCLNADGIKTDFMPDKIHDDMPPFDPAWRGEENYMFRFYALINRIATEIKPDFHHTAYVGHPWFVQHLHSNRTADIQGSNPGEQEARRKMLAATSYGLPIWLDCHNWQDHIEEYYDLSRTTGCPVEIFSIQYICRDYFSEPEQAPPSFYESLRGILNEPLKVQKWE